MLKPNWDPEELGLIFRLVPLKNQVIKNLLEVYQASLHGGLYLRPNPTYCGTRDELGVLISGFIESQRLHLMRKREEGLFEINGKVADWLERGSQKIKFVSNAFFRGLDPNDDFSRYIFDFEHDYYLEYCDDAEGELNKLDQEVKYRVVLPLMEMVLLRKMRRSSSSG